MRQHTRTVLAQHAQAMGVVHDQPGVVAFGQRKQFGQRCDVAIHAEHAIRDDQLVATGARGQKRFQRSEVDVRIDLDRRPRQPRTVDERSVVQRIGKDRAFLRLPDAASLRHGTHHGQIGHVARAEEQRIRLGNVFALQRSHACFQPRVRNRMAADQVRCAAAEAILLCALRHRLGQGRMRCQAEIIVAAKAENVARRFTGHADALAAVGRAVRGAAHAAQVRGVDSS